MDKMMEDLTFISIENYCFICPAIDIKLLMYNSLLHNSF